MSASPNPSEKPFNHRLISLASANATVVKASAGVVYGWVIANTNAAVRYVKLYDKATEPSSADIPVATIHLPITGTREISLPLGMRFDAGIAYRTVTLPADNDNTSVGAADIFMTLFWK